jgi:hypothetical protein
MNGLIRVMDGAFDATGKAILARRARKLFGRSFGPWNFEVKNLDLLPRPGYRNHVQVILESVKRQGIVLLVFQSFIDGDMYPFLSGKVQVAVACTRCNCSLSASWSTWLPRTTKGFRAGIESLLSQAKAHSCEKAYSAR